MSSFELLLRQRFPEAEYALMFEVPNATGVSARRSADAIAIGLWPSRGLPVIGFEFKSYRSDWLRELKTPEKAETIAAYCDRWYIVATDEKVVPDPNEVPIGWGLLVAKGEKLRLVREAPPQTPKPLDRKFVAALCRAAQKHAPGPRLINEAVEAAVAKVKQEHATEKASQTRHLQGELNAMRDVVAQFERASGIRLSHYTYDAGKIGDAVHAVMNEKARPHPGLKDAIQSIEAVLSSLREVQKLEALSKPVQTQPEAA